jgi:hypothetical protein
VRPAAEVNGRNGAPVVGGGEEEGAEQSTCQRKKMSGEGSGGPVWKFQKS